MDKTQLVAQRDLFAKGAYVSCVDGKVMVWDVNSLWIQAAHLPVKSVSLDKFPNFDKPCWLHAGEATVRNIAKHAKRIYETDLNYPVVLSDRGVLMDGMHRIAKAWILGWKEIPAVQFAEDPPPDRVWPIPEDGDIRSLIRNERQRLGAIAKEDDSASAPGADASAHQH